jgi:exodeoxyribonuclease VII small subunit
MAEAAVPGDIATLSFEDALAELEKIVSSLEEGSAKLEDAISAYERGTQLKQHCENKLKAARERVEKITLGQNGSVGGEVRTEPADIK